ncbi:hypothetical protein EJ05DRAFT_296735 [Pseudovirgaria hyperparasitica]|uniref:Uncharacterized protein n=1 Tax=Pseudovirgaria hyperparasitica TaxID=470096 RepID=A0A6A6VRZ6_9PEZI|nr:uncharacterized protein EJ05DRAFT_296735 [Pseudovirgaria hyperparasitica]KAF2752534.1 hypothetical protein EJ05DRAFT_296735 [Pseudovirgaria hyperparasitica]
MAISSPITSSNFEHSAIILALRLVAKCFNTIESSFGDAFLKAAHEIEPSRGEEEMLNAFRKLSLTIRTPRGPAVSLDKRSKTCRSLAGNNKSTARVSRGSGLISSITAPTNHGPTKEATGGRRSHGNIPVTVIPPIDHSRTGEAVDHGPTDGAPVGRQIGQTQSYDSDPLRNASNAQLEKQSDISSGSITGETAVSRLEALIKDHKTVKTSLTKGAIDRLVKIVRKMSIQDLPETTMPRMRPPESVKELWEQYKQFDRQCMERRRVFQMALTFCWVREIERCPTRTDNKKILEEIALNVGISKEDTKEMYGLYACGVTLLSLQPRVWIMTAGMKLDS